MEYTRIHRLLKLLYLIQANPTWNAPRLALECDTSERNLYRDLKQLQGAGIPIEHNHQTGGYTIGPSFFMTPVQLTGEEALALTALCQNISQDEQIPFLKAAWQALHKIESQLPGEIQRELAQKASALRIRTAPGVPAEGYQDVYDRVQESIASGRVLSCKYESVSGESAAEEFEFQPYTLFFSVRAWYVVGYHGKRKQVRCLKLNRFTKVALTDRAYEVPADFNLDEYLGNAWRMMNEGPDVHVEIWFDPEFAQTVSDTLWHKTQEIEWHPDNSCTFRCTVSGLAEIEWWVLSMGPHCVVKKPAELIDRIKSLTERTLQQYDPCAAAARSSED